MGMGHKVRSEVRRPVGPFHVSPPGQQLPSSWPWCQLGHWHTRGVHSRGTGAGARSSSVFDSQSISVGLAHQGTCCLCHAQAGMKSGDQPFNP